jgi:hypothetical protein
MDLPNRAEPPIYDTFSLLAREPNGSKTVRNMHPERAISFDFSMT